MAGRFYNPFPQFSSATAVYAGGTLTFYATGTSTPQNVYTDEGLSVAASNPLTLNSAGRPSVDIFLQDLEYKVVLKDSSGNTIWTADPVSARDSSYIAKTLTGSGSPNGSVAGTAGSASVLPDFYWDYTNTILYVCTTTGSSSTAVWTAVNSSAATPSVPPPQGRLTLTSATPMISASVTAVGTVYYTPYTGNLIPIYNGTSMAPTEFAELALTLVSSHAASTIYDIFVFSNAGVLTLVTGPAWNVSTAGSGSRGTGASTTQLARIKGLYVNAVAMTGRNGSTTYSVGANLATYVGSIHMDTNAGQVSCHVAWGQSRKWGIWNAYNRLPIMLKAGTASATWGNTPTTWRQSAGDSANTLAVFSGLAEEEADLSFAQNIAGSTNNTTSSAQIGIGVNSTTVLSGRSGTNALSNGSAVVITLETSPRATHILPASLGINNINSIEQAPAGTTNNTFRGTEEYMQLIAAWRG